MSGINEKSRPVQRPDAIGEAGNARFAELEDKALAAVLANFRSSVAAWSDAEFVRERMPVETVRQGSWRLAAGWALGAVLAAGVLGSGIYEHQQKAQAERMAASARAVEQQKMLAAKRAIEEEDLMAKVDSDVAREVPSALEPLAQLMDDESQ